MFSVSVRVAISAVSEGSVALGWQFVQLSSRQEHLFACLASLNVADTKPWQPQRALNCTWTTIARAPTTGQSSKQHSSTSSTAALTSCVLSTHLPPLSPVGEGDIPTEHGARAQAERPGHKGKPCLTRFSVPSSYTRVLERGLLPAAHCWRPTGVRCLQTDVSEAPVVLATTPRKATSGFYDALPLHIKADIEEHSKKPQTGVSLKYLLDFGSQPLERQMFESTKFLHREIPIRLAHRITDLDRLPPGLREQPQVVRIKGWYAQSFMELRSLPPVKEPIDVARFTMSLKNALRRHSDVVPTMAKGVEQYKRRCAKLGEPEAELQAFLDSFFLSRIALRFLAGQHCELFEPPASPAHIGLVHTACPVVQVASDAVADARSIGFREYGSAPSVLVHGPASLTFPYVPSHLHHMVFELVKNSLRAVQERFQHSDEEPPPISLVVAEGLEDVTIKVSDQGGGIPRSGMSRIWTYLYTTARSPLPDLDADGGDGPGVLPAVLAGYGCGLPLSRLYARYFGGSLQVLSMEGYGTDAYLHLNRLAGKKELLPGQA